VLIEAQRMGYQKLLGSDLNLKMVTQSTQNLISASFASEVHIFQQNSKYIHEVSILPEVATVVTE